MKFTSIILPVMLAMTVGLAGCDRISKKANAKPADNATLASSIAPDMASSAKLHLYSQAYNTMMAGQVGLKPTFGSFVARIRNTQKNEDVLLLSGGKLEQALLLFRQGFAIAGTPMPDMDKNVNDVIIAASVVAAKKDLMQGQPTAGSATLQASYESLYAALDRMEPLLFQYRKAELEKRMASYKKAGNPLGFYTEQSLVNAQNLLSLFAGSNGAINDSDTYDRGDVILSALEASLAGQRRAYDLAAANDVGQLEKYPSIHRILTSMVGSYRDLRQNRTLSDLATLNKKYNEALETNRQVSMLSPE